MRRIQTHRRFDSWRKITYNVSKPTPKPTMSTADSALAKVQSLYMLQAQLWNVLEAKNLSPNARIEAKKNLKEFSSLLRSADWRVMGGEDVYVALKEVQTEVSRKLSSRGTISSRPTVRRRATSKA